MKATKAAARAGRARRILGPRAFASPDTPRMARALLGKVLVRTVRGRRRASVITETEAYHTEKDLACHASKGRTRRTEVLFRRGGDWYVYLVYGMHRMLNVVTGPREHAAAVLIRGLGHVAGPGRLTREWSIGMDLNGARVGPGSGLHVEDWGFAVPRGGVEATPRVGVDYAGPFWASRPWRFVLKASLAESFGAAIALGSPRRSGAPRRRRK